MLKKFLKIREEKGTALITALLVMGVLTAISLAVSTLIIREISITRLAIDSGKAYYAAESGIEEALLKLKEGGVDEDAVDVEFSGNGGAGSATYTIKNTSKSYPVVEGKSNGYPAAYYSYLDVNESVTIPLFVGDDTSGKVTDFVVQYFIDLRKGDFIFNEKNPSLVTHWDVLRWKVYGIKEDSGRTESINDFTPVSMISDGTGGGETLTSAANPSWFGTMENWEGNKEDDFTMNGEIEYTGYYDGRPMVVPTDVDGTTVYQGYCPRTSAREHYKYDGNNVIVVECFSIKEFLDNHEQNYLVLTNMMNPSVLNFKSKENRENNSRLYYRVISEQDMPREFADITATGEAGDSKIVLNMLRKRDSFMPVFNFALYHTGED